MQGAAHHFELGHSLKTSPVLGEVVDVQLREASWATLARSRQVADPTASLQALRRWENYLSGNMAGLASVMNTRLATRLTDVLASPKELTSEAFVAAVLLLRCDRTRHEGTVFAAWRAAAATPELQDHLTQGIIHGGLQDPTHLQALEAIMLGDDAAQRAHAARIITAHGLPVSDALQPLGLRARTCFNTLTLVLNLMARGIWPLDARPLAFALTSEHPDAVHAAEQTLSCFAPSALAHRAREQLRQQQAPSLLGLEALASMQLEHGPLHHDDLQLLGRAALRGRLGPLVAQSLGLTGSHASAQMLLQLLRTAVTEPMRAAALEGFTAITGIEAPQEEAQHQAGHADTLVRHLEAAWGPQATAEKDAGTQLLFGAAAGPQQLAQAVPLMQVGRWQSLRRLLLSRSLGAARLSPWALMQQQLRELEHHSVTAQEALTPQAPGLQPTRLAQAIKNRLAP